MTSAHPHDGRHDFDFCFGHWTVHNRRLKQRFAGSTEWEQFDAAMECRPVLGGLGNIDDFTTDWNAGAPGCFIGMTLRLYDLATRAWSLYWAGNRSGVLEPPVVGRFENGVGTFAGDDLHDGRPVRVRFTWSQIRPDGARWEQAMSADGGRTWESNWIMQLARDGGAAR